MTDWVNIGGLSVDVLVKDIEENYTVMYSENTGRTLEKGVPMALDPLGTFFGHKITFCRKNGHEAEFDVLYDFLSQPRNSGIHVEIVHNQTKLSYDAYVSNGSRKLTHIENGKVYWGEFAVNIIPIKAQVTP